MRAGGITEIKQMLAGTLKDMYPTFVVYVEKMAQITKPAFHLQLLSYNVTERTYLYDIDLLFDVSVFIDEKEKITKLQEILEDLTLNLKYLQDDVENYAVITKKETAEAESVGHLTFGIKLIKYDEALAKTLMQTLKLEGSL